ncbi:hypothetical protein [Vibrio parahaemolyticus]|uniref:hypothetical protein n=1 Tax=Vibrio parahaemolyticus TaxID=670 RepID=UPI0009F04540|nr:hypothetical protein [Vibrio parahaemolyticus]EIA4666862.1 hypothetical protein [Vibrio parahaemolyticus]OQT70247.1 hypothetical protein EM98_025455 [Vibrio parahaemolyticus]
MFKERTEVIAYITENELNEKFDNKFSEWIKSICGKNKSFKFVGEYQDKKTAELNAQECSSDIGICSYIDSEVESSRRILELEQKESDLIDNLKAIDAKRRKGENSFELDIQEAFLNSQLEKVDSEMAIEWNKIEIKTKVFVLIADY